MQKLISDPVLKILNKVDKTTQTEISGPELEENEISIGKNTLTTLKRVSGFLFIMRIKSKLFAIKEVNESDSEM